MTDSERHEVATRAAASILGIDRSRIRLVVDGADAPAWPGEEELRRLSDAAAPGPWFLDDEGELCIDRGLPVSIWNDAWTDETAAFIVALVNAYRDGRLAALSRPPAPDDGWRPIESAPRGEDILVGCGDVDGPGVWWQSVAWLDPDDVDPLDGFDNPPTHWHRLPAPPPSDEPGQEAEQNDPTYLDDWFHDPDMGAR